MTVNTDQSILDSSLHDRIPMDKHNPFEFNSDRLRIDPILRLLLYKLCSLLLLFAVIWRFDCLDLDWTNIHTILKKREREKKRIFSFEVYLCVKFSADKQEWKNNRTKSAWWWWWSWNALFQSIKFGRWEREGRTNE